MVRQIRIELKAICGLKNAASILRSGNEGLQNFSWTAIWKEFSQGVPTLLKLLQKILPLCS